MEKIDNNLFFFFSVESMSLFLGGLEFSIAQYVLFSSLYCSKGAKGEATLHITNISKMLNSLNKKIKVHQLAYRCGFHPELKLR